ncbi:hypothetical protein Glove_139g26 [Diversispora epigaea]|uniref:Serine-threonine/tyrosine-protein kinase catalytic domain-containing protein n=1 Tax=Diversispora epigaea TaxID=1348612 RepID=A0A397J5S2_9GLOM|nr:hypothetical protein Glove_139g26 [Diversispora epigaea]
MSTAKKNVLVSGAIRATHHILKMSLINGQGSINNWDNEDQLWKSYGQLEVNISKGGNLGNHLNMNFNNIDWNVKLDYLNEFKKIHKLDIVHRDFHLGNISKISLEERYLNISDFGLSKSIAENIKNLQKDINWGEYTKAADVNSFAFIAYEIITGIPPYHDLPHDKDLSVGTLELHIDPLLKNYIKSWINTIEIMTTTTTTITIMKLQFKLKTKNFFKNRITINLTTTTTPINYKTHPQAIYTSDDDDDDNDDDDDKIRSKIQVEKPDLFTSVDIAKRS